jgi:hypothetical protein
MHRHLHWSISIYLDGRPVEVIKMRLFLVLTIVAAAASGCQAVPRSPDYRWNCNDKPFEAGLCDQPTNWRISQLFMQR